MGNKEIGALVTISIMLFLGFMYPLTLTLGNQELSNPEISFKLFLFSLILIVGAVGTLAIFFVRLIWKRDNKYGDSFGFYSIGEKPSLKFFGRFTPLQLAMLLFIVFSSLFLTANLLKTNGVLTSNEFTSTITLPQQFSKTDSLLFSTFLVPIAEESMNIFIMGLLMLSLVALSKKYKLSPKEFQLYAYIAIPIITGALAVVWHINAYAGSDIAKTSVFFFWAFKNLIILATGFIFAGIFMHMGNNFFIDFGQLYSSDVVLITAVTLIFSVAVLYYFLYRGNLFGGGRKKQGVLV